MDRSLAETVLLLLGATLVLALLEIGFASGEMVRHMVQATPVAAMTLVAAWGRPAWTRWLLGPPMAFWLLIAICIGLFLAHLPSPIRGAFNPGERAGTAAMAAIGITGFALFPRIKQPFPLWAGALMALASLALQLGAMVLSVQKAIAHI
jgi:hypothetical protein